uniref:SH2 domain-containing protein n=1 Tax=Oryzias latipes TaxID=8090 RepID=A0A3P9H0L9_ORYLA
MCQTLNCKFTSEVNTQHNLDKFNQHFLAQKIFDKPDFNGDFSEMMVSWAQFNKEVLPGRSFTFWQWFEGVTELSKKHLRPYWSEGLIFGFIGKHHLHMILHDRPNGTFLLRFSDSEIGGITIAYVSACEIQNIQPFSKKDLEIRSLADRIRDINEILYLYPNVGKDEAFGKFYTGETLCMKAYKCDWHYLHNPFSNLLNLSGKTFSWIASYTTLFHPVNKYPQSKFYFKNKYIKSFSKTF